MTLVLTSFVGILGLAIGSFLNVVVYRVPNGLSVVRPASACPGCGSAIAGRDNVPVLSWLMLRGRCRECSMTISARYPVVEAITGLAFVIVALVVVPGVLTAPTPELGASRAIELVAYLYLAGITVALTAIDLDVHRLPNRIVYPSFVVGAVLLGSAAIVRGDVAALAVMGIAAVGSSAFYFLLALVYPGGMGLGDVKLAAVIGLYLGSAGWAAVAVGTAGAFLLGGVFGIVLLVTRIAQRRAGIPFGPWMFAGAWIGIFFGDQVAGGYLSLVGLN